MADIADVSDAGIANALEEAMKQVRRKHHLQADGRCYFCEEPVPEALLFCDVDCRDDYEKEQAALRRAGHSRGTIT